MHKLKTIFRRNFLMSLICAVAALAIVVPVVAATPAGVQGFYFIKAPVHLYDTDGVAYDFEFPYFGLSIDQTDEVLTGYLFGFNASTVHGSKVRGGTATYTGTMDDNLQDLEFGAVNLTVTSSNGTLGLYLKTGCLATVINSTGAISGSPKGCVPGWNTLNVTANGTLWVYTYIDYTFLGDVAGTVGSSRLVLVGPDLVTDFDAGNSAIAGVTGVYPDDECRVVAPGAIFSVTGNGTATIELPTGSSGLAEGTSLTVNGGANETLTAGRAIELVLSDAPGTLTITITSDRAFQLSAKVGRSLWTRRTALSSGRMEGFLILDNNPWNAKVLSVGFACTNSTLDPILD